MKIHNNFIKNIDIGLGQITYCDFNIDPVAPLKKQLPALQEDMLQIEFGNRFLIDVGWYPAMGLNGCFIVYVIQDEDWDHPLSKAQCSTLKELKNAIEKAAAFIHNLSK